MSLRRHPHTACFAWPTDQFVRPSIHPSSLQTTSGLPATDCLVFIIRSNLTYNLTWMEPATLLFGTSPILPSFCTWEMKMWHFPYILPSNFSFEYSLSIRLHRITLLQVIFILLRGSVMFSSPFVQQGWRCITKEPLIQEVYINDSS